MGLAGLAYFNYKFPYIDETLQIAKNESLKAEWKIIYKQLTRTSNSIERT